MGALVFAARTAYQKGAGGFSPTVARTVTFHAAIVAPNRGATRPSEARPGALTHATVGVRIFPSHSELRSHSGAFGGPAGLCGDGGSPAWCARGKHEGAPREPTAENALLLQGYRVADSVADSPQTQAPVRASEGGRCVPVRRTCLPHGAAAHSCAGGQHSGGLTMRTETLQELLGMECQ